MMGLAELRRENEEAAARAKARTARAEVARKASLRRLKQRIARISYGWVSGEYDAELGRQRKSLQSIRREISEAIDEWDRAERRRAHDMSPP